MNKPSGLLIRPAQMQAFQPLAEAALVSKIARYLQRWQGHLEIWLPEELVTIRSLPTEKLEQLVRQGVQRAVAYGMSWETSLSAFTVILFVVAPNFDDHPLLRRVLLDNRVPPDERIKALWQQTTEANWEVARKDYDPRAWAVRGQQEETP